MWECLPCCLLFDYLTLLKCWAANGSIISLEWLLGNTYERREGKEWNSYCFVHELIIGKQGLQR